MISLRNSQHVPRNARLNVGFMLPAFDIRFHSNLSLSGSSERYLKGSNVQVSAHYS